MSDEELKKHMISEMKGARGRVWTPRLVATNLIANLLGSGTIIALLAYFGNLYVDGVKNQILEVNKRIEGVMTDDKDERSKFWDRFASLEEKQQCIKLGLIKCCGSRAEVNC